MKNILGVLIFCSFMASFTSCKKDDFDVNEPSTGNLSNDSLGGCLQMVVHGKYEVDTTFTAENYIDVKVNVRTEGTYTITTNTVNGFSFSGSGRLGNPGGNTVRLYGVGKPILNGIFPVRLSYNGTTCIANIPIGGGTSGNAVYTMGGAPTNCSGVNLFGTWKAGQIIGAGTNYAVMNVNVSYPGRYTINVATVNGVTFTASDVFNTNGVQSVALKASGTPINSGSYNYEVNSPTTKCTFTVNYQ